MSGGCSFITNCLNCEFANTEILCTAGGGFGNKVVADLCDWLPIGVILVDVKGRVVFINRCAREMSEALKVDRQGFLRATTPAATIYLRALIARAAANSLDEESEPLCRVMPLLPPTRLHPLSVIVAPFKQVVRKPYDRYPVAAIFVTDPDRKYSMSYDYLKSVYGLTQTESQVTAALASGKGLEHAANITRMSLNTAKTHLRHVFDKTRTNRQAELVRLIVGTGAAVRLK